jgi:hypothetical protein
MTEDIGWELLAGFDYGYEVDFAEATLAEAGIPVVVKGREAGIWGPGFAGPSSQGLSLWVPAARMMEARELLAPGADPGMDPSSDLRADLRADPGSNPGA